MISKDELRRMVIIREFTDTMLEKMIPLVERLQFDERQPVFRQGDSAERFYLLIKGKVLLEQRLSDKMTVSMDAIKPGYSFGWSSIVRGTLNPYSRYTSDAICVEPSEVFAIKGEDFHIILEEDHSMGYIINRNLNRVIKQRLVYRTEQFVRIIKKHPDMESLINS